MSSTSYCMLDISYSLDVIMLDMADKFSSWLVEELNKKDWSQAELARRAKISRTSISDLISEKHNPGVDICNAIASALNYRVEDVYRIAGLLPPERKNNSLDNEMLHLFGLLPENEKQQVIDYVRYIFEKVESRKNR